MYIGIASQKLHQYLPTSLTVVAAVNVVKNAQSILQYLWVFSVRSALRNRTHCGWVTYVRTQPVTWFKQLLEGLSLRRLAFNLRPDRVGFMVDKVTLKSVSLRVAPSLLVSTILSMLRTNSFIYIRGTHSRKMKLARRV